jgi:hypothetical protein
MPGDAVGGRRATRFAGSQNALGIRMWFMKIARSPYHANIAPHKGRENFLWFCVIRREGSAEVVVRHDAASKEDACCAALWELVRLQPAGDTASQRVSQHR